MCAVIKRGILGGFSNKIGNVVGTSWKGIAVMKSMPLSVANPRTAGQVAQRTAFGQASKFASQFLSFFVKDLWDRFAQQESGFNAFIKANISVWTFVGGPNWSTLKISIGKMALTAIASTATSAAGDTVTITWNDDSGDGYKLADDIAYAIVINKTQNLAFAGPTEAVRSDEGLVITVPGLAVTNQIYVKLAFKRADGSIVSNTSGSFVNSAT